MSLYLKRTSTTPEVDFKFSTHQLSMTGEIYPENAQAFFAPILDELHHYLQSATDRSIEVNMDLTYFNSASTRMLYNLFNQLDWAAAAGNQITVTWYHDEEDSNSLEFCEDIKESFEHLKFNVIATL